MTRPEGDLGTQPFAEYLADAHRQRLDGTLLCCRRKEIRRVHLRAGVPVWADSDDPEESLGAHLFRHGRVGLRQTGVEPGQLIEQGLSDDEAIGQQCAHALDLLLDLFPWADGRCEFVEPTSPTPAQLREGYPAIASFGVARTHRLAVLRRGAGPLTATLAVAPDVPEEIVRSLPEETCSLLGAIRAGDRDGADLPSEYRILQSVWALRLLDVVVTSDDGITLASLLEDGTAAATPASEMPPPPVAEPAPALFEPPFDELGDIELPLAEAATTDPPVDAPPPVAALPPAAAPPPAAATPVETLPPKKPTAEWASKLPTPTFEKLDPSEIATSETERTQAAPAPEQAQMWFKIGEQALRKMDKYRAVTAFREASKLAPDNVTYRFRLGMAMAENPKWRKDAEVELLRCEEMRPWDPKVHIALGKLYRMSNLDKRAVTRFQKALSLDGNNAEAAKELKSLGAKMKKDGGFLDRLRRPLGKTSDGASKTDQKKPEADEMALEV